jgi:non-canonical purine NTP pyrophosphatase (RdgB/HAM1 family)
MEKIVFVTSNQGKVDELSRYLGMQFEHVSLELPEIQSLNIDEIVKDKVTRAYDKLKRPVLVEDVSFVFNSLGKLPGPLIKWFSMELGTNGLCRMLDSFSDRSCEGIVCYGYHDGKEVKLAKGTMKGSISMSPRGSNSFGWAPTFIPEGMSRTYAELTPAEQEPISMRNKAMVELRRYLK